MNKMESRNTNSAIAMVPNTENEKGIENHKKAAKHLTEAANNHIQAAKYHQSGNHAKAAQHTLTAIGHVNLANEAQKEDVKHHVING